jgi:microcystin-dependent protein
MATVLLSPVGNGQQFFDNNGVPLAGGLIYTYQAGSSTLFTTYTTNNGTVPNSNPIILDAAGRTPQEIWLEVGYSYKFIIQTSAGVTLQTLDNLYPILQNSTGTGTVIPTGLITLWSGAVGSIPSGWALCNGANGTPDLRNRFIIGAGSAYSVGSTGGSANSIVVSHTHTATSVVTDPGHEHVSNSVGLSNVNINWVGTGGADYNTSGSEETASATTGITVGTTISSAGASGTNANLPPYYALAYIMKT